MKKQKLLLSRLNLNVDPNTKIAELKVGSSNW
jgi:hypothetical protein